MRWLSSSKSRLLKQLAVFFSFFGALWLKYKCKGEFETPIFVALIGAIITSYWSLSKQWLDQDQAFKDLFRDFNKRFDQLNEPLNEIVKGQFDSRTQDRIIQDYLNLCSEEYLWYKKGRIDKEVWKAWKAGILYYIDESKAIKAYFIKERLNNISYYGLFNELKLNHEDNDSR